MQKKRYIMKMRKIVDSSKAASKQRERRERGIRYIITSLPSAESLILSGSAEKLPLIQLWEASIQFISGFYQTSILNSAFAAEYGLLLRLNEKLEQVQKDKIANKKGGLSFRDAINKSRGTLIDEDLAKRLDVLNNLRDMSAHPSNWVTLLKELEERTFLSQEPMKDWISETTHTSPDEIAERLKDDFDPDMAKKALDRLINVKDKQWGKLPDLQWAAHKKTLRFQTEVVVKDYSKKLIRDLISNKEIVKLINKSNNPAEYIQRKYRYPEELANKAIQIAHETLRQLHFGLNIQNKLLHTNELAQANQTNRIRRNRTQTRKAEPKPKPRAKTT